MATERLIATTESEEKFFNDFFATFQQDLKGSETEILLIKRVAWQWYQVGRRSMVRELLPQQEAITNWLRRFPLETLELSDLKRSL